MYGVSVLPSGSLPESVEEKTFALTSFMGVGHSQTKIPHLLFIATEHRKRTFARMSKYGFLG